MPKGEKTKFTGLGWTPFGFPPANNKPVHEAKYSADTSADFSMETSADFSADTSADFSMDTSADFSGKYSMMTDQSDGDPNT